MSTPRTGHIARHTKETQIELTLALDDPSTVALDTDLPFLDHMLNTLACHGKMGLTVTGRGDIHVDPHHLVEDVGIAFGQALAKALGDFTGIERAGCFSFPMDHTLAHVALDLCNRPNLAWHVPLKGQPLGTLDGRLFAEFFKGLVDGCRMTLHVNVSAVDNDHHAIEAVFKAFARALYAATRPIAQQGVVLSTKGTLSV
jgi:imidazoleglycerol-phosphate dehydratase